MVGEFNPCNALQGFNHPNKIPGQNFLKSLIIVIYINHTSTILKGLQNHFKIPV